MFVLYTSTASSRELSRNAQEILYAGYAIDFFFRVSVLLGFVSLNASGDNANSDSVVSKPSTTSLSAYVAGLPLGRRIIIFVVLVPIAFGFGAFIEMFVL